MRRLTVRYRVESALGRLKNFIPCTKYHPHWVSGYPLWQNCRYVQVSQVTVFIGCKILHVLWLWLLCADL